MNTRIQSIVTQLRPAIAFAVAVVLLGCGIYPLVVWAFAQLAFPVQANGSLVTRDGIFTSDPKEAVGSALLAQAFVAPGYFHPRPSAAGSGYDAANSGGTNLGPLSNKLLFGVHGAKNADGTPDFDGIKDLVTAYRRENGLGEAELVPADAVTRSGSGLDPHISVDNALSQARRVGKARGVSPERLTKLIAAHTSEPALAVFGERAVNVLMLNLALDKLTPPAAVAP